MSTRKHKSDIADISLDNTFRAVRLSPDIDRERRIAIEDLLHRNIFQCPEVTAPYTVKVSLRSRAVRFDIASADKTEHCTDIRIPLSSFRRLIKDYFLVCENYYKMARQASHAHIEAIDMGRRALHDEAAGLLKKRFAQHDIETDLPTARRLFTLICVLHMRVMY